MRFLIFAAGLMVMSVSLAQGEQQALCAWVTLDDQGDVWIDGQAAVLDAVHNRECEESDELVLAVEYATPSRLVALNLTQLQNTRMPLRYFFPSSRRDIVTIFGFDPLMGCANVSRYVPSALPDRQSIEFTTQNTPRAASIETPVDIVISGAGSKVRIVAASVDDSAVIECRNTDELGDVLSNSEIRWIVTDGEVSWGVVDHVVNHILTGSVQSTVVVLDSGTKQKLEFSAERNYIPPPPKIPRRTVVAGNGEVTAIGQPNFEELNRNYCPYSKSDRQSN